jgi:hypothetical protein
VDAEQHNGWIIPLSIGSVKVRLSKKGDGSH